MSHPLTFRVLDSVFCVMRKSYFTCSYLVTSDAGVVAVDAGMKSTGSDMLHALGELKRSPGDLRAILITHWHNDHSAGAAQLAQLSGAPVYYHQAEAAHLTGATIAPGLRSKISRLIPETGPLVLFKGLLGDAPDNPVAATRHVNSGQTLLDSFDVMETPGHTPGHVSFFHRPTRTLFAGDALAVINGRLRFMSRPVTENLQQARESMLRLLELPIENICPGHREPLTNAGAECQRMREYLINGGKWPLLG
jgi:glyoxylase-like metal-dependent hydrolase (beta-lactamase superfamily II)